jgi:hypothetical protein
MFPALLKLQFMSCPVLLCTMLQNTNIQLVVQLILKHLSHSLISSNRGHLIFDEPERKNVNKRTPQLNMVQSKFQTALFQSDAITITKAPLEHTLETCLLSEQ